MAAEMNNTRGGPCFLLFPKCKIITATGNFSYNQTCINILFETYSCGRGETTNSPNSIDADPNLTLVVVLILIAVFSLSSNVFVCLVYAFCREIRAAKHYFIVNLAIADSLIAALAIPFFLASYFCKGKAAVAVTLCQISSAFDVLCCTSSIVNFTVISVERFIAIKYPLRYRSIVSRRRCLWAVGFVWLYAVLTSVSSRIPVGDLHMNECVFFTKPYITTITFTSFLLPLFAMLLTYGWIFKIARFQARQIYSSTPSGIKPNVKHEFKAAKTLSVIIGVFVVCWFPFFAYICVAVVFEVKAVETLAIHDTVQVVRYLNSLANPFIYVGISREFRRKALKLLRGCTWSGFRQNNDMESSNYSVSTATVLQTTSQALCSCRTDTNSKQNTQSQTDKANV